MRETNSKQAGDPAAHVAFGVLLTEGFKCSPLQGKSAPVPDKGLLQALPLAWVVFSSEHGQRLVRRILRGGGGEAGEGGSSA